MVCTLGGFEQGDGTGVLGFVRLVGVVRLVDVFAAVEAGGHIAAGVDDGPVLVLVLARGHLAVAVAVALDSGVLLAGLRFGGVVPPKHLRHQRACVWLPRFWIRILCARKHAIAL